MIIDVNDNKFFFDKLSYNLFIDEDVFLGMFVEKVFVIDNDMGKNKEIIYNIKIGNEEGKFNMNEKIGEIIFNQIFDYEMKVLYFFVVIVIDYGSFFLMLLVDVMVIVIDVNDNVLLFLKLLYNCIVVENLVSGVVVCYVIVSDVDFGVNGQLFYFIVIGDIGKVFGINMVR